MVDIQSRLRNLARRVRAHFEALQTRRTGRHTSTPNLPAWEDPVLNEGSGQLVISRYRAVLASNLPTSAGLCELVESDVGELWFPRFDQYLRPAIRKNGSWEPDEAAFLEAFVEPGTTVMNIGANVGYTTLLLARLVGPDGRVIALEPEPLNYQLLCTNVALNRVRTVVPIQSAAGDVTGSIQLAYSPDNSGDHRTVRHPLAVGAVTVPVVKIDDLIPEDVRIGVIVCDTQGFDHRVFAGMASVRNRCRPALLMEFWPSGILEAGDDPCQVVSDYQSAGYEIKVITTGDDVTDSSPEEVVAIALDGRDHVSLGLTPR